MNATVRKQDPMQFKVHNTQFFMDNRFTERLFIFS